jgi:hypothetical protein
MHSRSLETRRARTADRRRVSRASSAPTHPRRARATRRSRQVRPRGNPVPYQIRSALLVAFTARKQLRPDLDHAVQPVDVQRPLRAKSNLHVTELHRTDPRLFRAVDRLSDEVGKECTEFAERRLRHGVVVGHINERHDAIFAPLRMTAPICRTARVKSMRRSGNIGAA